MSSQMSAGNRWPLSQPDEKMVPSTNQSPLADLARTSRDQASVITSLTHLLEDKILKAERLGSELSSENDSKDMDNDVPMSGWDYYQLDRVKDFVEEFERVLNPDRPVALGLDVTTLKPLMKLYRQLPEWVRSQAYPSFQSFQALKEKERALQAESYKSTGKYDQDPERIESPTETSRKSEWLVKDKSEPSAWQAPQWFRDEHGPTCQCSACVWNRPISSSDYWNK